MAQNAEKAALIAELASARARIASQWTGLRHDLDFPARAKRSFSIHPAPWIGGATFLGLLFGKQRPRTKKIEVTRKTKSESLEKAGKAGLLLGILKIVLDFVRPALTAWVTKRISEYSSGGWKADGLRR